MTARERLTQRGDVLLAEVRQIEEAMQWRGGYVDPQDDMQARRLRLLDQYDQIEDQLFDLDMQEAG